MLPSIHEDLSRDEAAGPGSDRAFGLVIAMALALLGLLNLWHHGRLWPWMLTAATASAALAWLRPSALHLLNRGWTRLGVLLHRVVSPVVLAVLFFGGILPTGLLMRLRGKELLRLKRLPEADSYWLPRAPGPTPESMREQF